MLHSSRLTSWFAGIGLLFTAALAGASCGGGSSTSDLVSACEKYCAAQAKPACTKGLAEDTCKSQCSAAPAAFGEQCIDETTAALDCVSGLEFTCTMDFPTPKPTGCITESQALQKCQKEAPCRSYCKAAVAAGCGGASEDACFTACEAEIEKQSFCGSDLGRVRTCESQQMLKCVNGKATTPLCVQEKGSYVDCLAFDDPCSAFCYLADDAGCAGGTMDACVMTCQTQYSMKPNCQFNYQDYVRCVGEKGLTCSNGMATAASCTTEKTTYDTCVMMP